MGRLISRFLQNIWAFPSHVFLGHFKVLAEHEMRQEHLQDLQSTCNFLIYSLFTVIFCDDKSQTQFEPLKEN